MRPAEVRSWSDAHFILIRARHLMSECSECLIRVIRSSQSTTYLIITRSDTFRNALDQSSIQDQSYFLLAFSLTVVVLFARLFIRLA